MSQQSDRRRGNRDRGGGGVGGRADGKSQRGSGTVIVLKDAFGFIRVPGVTENVYFSRTEGSEVEHQLLNACTVYR